MTEFLEVAGGRTAYDVTGEGPLVVLAPGVGDLRATYRSLVPGLVAAGYRVAATDLRGHGESSTGFASYANADCGSDLAALIRRLGGGPAVVFGNSFSGGTAVWLAANEPDLVAGLVLEGAFTRPTKPSAFQSFALKLVGRSPALWGMYYKSLYPGPKPDDFAAYLTTLKANLREPGRLAAVMAMLSGTKGDLAGALGRSTTPALVVMGAKDKDFPDPRAEADTIAAEHGGRTDIAMIEGAGHYPHAQFPDETLAAVLPFLREVAPVRNGGE